MIIRLHGQCGGRFRGVGWYGMEDEGAIVLLEHQQVSKIYRMGATEVHALRNVDVEIDRGRDGGDHGLVRIGQVDAC